MVSTQENDTLLKVQSALKAQFNSRDPSSSNQDQNSTSPVGTPSKKQKLSHSTSASIFDKPRRVVKAFAADRGLDMVTNELAESAFEDAEEGGDSTMPDEEDDDDDNDNDEIKYVKTSLRPHQAKDR